MLASPATSYSCRRIGRSTTRFSRGPTTSDRYAQQAVIVQFFSPLALRPSPTVSAQSTRRVYEQRVKLQFM